MTLAPQELPWYDVPQKVKELLNLAANHWENTELSTSYINQAIDQAGNNLDVLVSAYRYFFYKNQPNAALHTANRVLALIEEQEKLPQDWILKEPILIARHEEPIISLYLNAYASTGYIFAKIGEIEKAKEVSERVKTIDPNSKSCAQTVFEVLTAPPDED